VKFRKKAKTWLREPDGAESRQRINLIVDIISQRNVDRKTRSLFRRNFNLAFDLSYQQFYQPYAGPLALLQRVKAYSVIAYAENGLMVPFGSFETD
jgi:hypothetical protein